jgi:hypothetical protein
MTRFQNLSGKQLLFWCGLTVLVLIGMALLVGCTTAAQPQGKDIVTGKTVVTNLPESDSGVRFVGGSGLPTDQRVYHITGTVVGDAESLVRQVSPARGSISGYGSYVGGSFSGEVLKGKTMVRLQLESIAPNDTDWVTAGQILIIKASDTKAVALYPGDKVTFYCRRQAEAVAAINRGEWYDADNMTTWELDYCRLASPVVTYDLK